MKVEVDLEFLEKLLDKIDLAASAFKSVKPEQKELRKLIKEFKERQNEKS